MASQTGSIDLKGLNIAGSVQQYFWADSDGIHVTQISQDEYLADPSSAGINILINSTDGMQILDGTSLLAFYSTSVLIGASDGAHVEITTDGVNITSPDGDAFSVSQGSGTAQILVTESVNESATGSPYSFVIPNLQNAVSGTELIVRYWGDSGTSSYKELTFTIGVAGQKTTYTGKGSIAYDGNQTLTYTNISAASPRCKIVSVLYYANKIVPAITMQGQATVDGTFSVNGNLINETVIEQGVKAGNHGTWFYRKWSSGMIEAWYDMNVEVSVNINTSSAGTYRGSMAVTIPSGIFDSTPDFGYVNSKRAGGTIHGNIIPGSATSAEVLWTRDSSGTNIGMTASIYLAAIPNKIT